MRIAIILSLAALALFASACDGNTEASARLPPASGEGAKPLPKLPKIETATVSSKLSASGGRTTGTTFAHDESQVGPNLGGVLIKIFVKEGDRVKRGDPLFKQDTRDLQLRVEQARVGLEAAKINLRGLEAEYARSKTLLEGNALNRAQWDQIQTRYDSARIGVEQSQVSLQMAQKALDDATVRSPIDGVITAKLKSEGEMATMMPPTVVVIVQNLDTLDLKFRLPEHALATVKPGATLHARFGALAVTREARIVRIQPAVDARTRTIELIAEISNKDMLLRPGLLAEVELGGTAP
jgi:RND family efflux transporter MFP subunit